MILLFHIFVRFCCTKKRQSQLIFYQPIYVPTLQRMMYWLPYNEKTSKQAFFSVLIFAVRNSIKEIEYSLQRRKSSVSQLVDQYSR